MGGTGLLKKAEVFVVKSPKQDDRSLHYCVFMNYLPYQKISSTLHLGQLNLQVLTLIQRPLIEVFSLTSLDFVVQAVQIAMTSYAMQMKLPLLWFMPTLRRGQQ